VQDGKVFRSVIAVIAGAILIEADVEQLMHAVLDGPMCASSLGEGCGREGSGRDVVALLMACLASSLDRCFDHADHRQACE